MLAAQRHHDEPHKNSMGGGGMQGGSGAMSMSCSPALDSSQDGVHDIDDEKLDVVGTSDGRDGASPLHISDGKFTTHSNDFKIINWIILWIMLVEYLFH